MKVGEKLMAPAALVGIMSVDVNFSSAKMFPVKVSECLDI
jgi:hypothetical protein